MLLTPSSLVGQLQQRYEFESINLLKKTLHSLRSDYLYSILDAAALRSWIMSLDISFEKALIRLGISQAREKRAVVTSIIINNSYQKNRELRESLDKWIKRENVLLDESSDSSSYKYGGPSYNGRHLSGRSESTTELFSTFKVITSTDDGYINSITFEKFNTYEGIEKYENYDPTKTPSMLQIFYGLRKKYSDGSGLVSVDGDFDLSNEERQKLNSLKPTPEEIQQLEKRRELLRVEDLKHKQGDLSRMVIDPKDIPF